MSEIWFIKEAAIEDEAQDEFGHRDLALEVKAKIEQMGAPLTLSLEAPHGVGKSCVGMLLRRQLAGDNYEFVAIEAWRHAGESRRKAFLYDVIEELRKKRDLHSSVDFELGEVQKQIYDSLSHQSSVMDGASAIQSFNVLRRGWGNLWNFCKRILRSPTAILITMALLALFGILSWWLFKTGGTSPALALVGLSAAFVALFQFLGLGTFVAFISGLGSKALPQLLEASKVTVSTSAPSSSEQFETLFRKTLGILKTEGANQKQQPRTLVIFVDELDRLPEAEIIEALNVLRAFRDVDPCVVLVALDEAIVKRALRNRTSDSAGAIRDDAEAEEFLNKFFKMRQHLPPVVVQEMGDFARALIQKGRLTGGIGALHGVELDIVLDSLIHPGVATPRHTIRLLNAFNSDLHLARCRESNKSNGVLRPGSVTNHLPFLAVLTALREDFARFHSVMTVNTELLRAIDAGLERGFDGEWQKEFPDYVSLCADYFAAEEADGKTVTLWDTPSPQWRDLILHLRATRPYHRDEVAPFLFFRQDVAARSLGSEEARSLREELASHYVGSVLTRLGNEGAPFAQLLATVAEQALAETRAGKRANVIASVCDLWDTLAPLLDDSKKRALSHEIARLVDEDAALQPFMRVVSPSALLDVLAPNHAQYHQARCIHTQVERLSVVMRGQDEVRAEDEPLDEGLLILDGVLRHPTVVSSADQGSIQEFTGWLTGQLTLEQMLPWLHKAREGSASVAVVPGVFGLKFLVSRWMKAC